MRMFLIYILAVFFFSCNSFQDTYLDPLTKDQKIICVNLLSKNDSIMSNKFGLPVNLSYLEQLQLLQESESPNLVSDNYFLKDSSFYKDLKGAGIFKLDKLTLNPKVYKTGLKDSVLNRYEFNLDNSYLEFLAKYSEENQLAKRYYNELLMDGGISPALTAMLLNGTNKTDLEHREVRLILSLHFLLINQ